MGETGFWKWIRKALPYIMVFFSGFAGLVYQVLWMRQLGLLLGNTAYAAATVLAVFFGGLATGSWFWGRRVSKAKHPLGVYGFLEFGIALGALFFFAVMPLFRLLYPALFQAVGFHPLLFVVKFILGFCLIFPASFFMGGAIPAMGQYLIVEKIYFGRTAAWLYGINTIGASIGAFGAAFLLIPSFGFTVTCIGAMVLTSAIAATALLFSSSAYAKEHSLLHHEPLVSTSKELAEPDTVCKRGRLLLRVAPFGIAFGSGFCVLALEVLWTRMFAQVHENSVYSFSMVLVIVLICLAIGALLSSCIARTQMPPWLFLRFLLAGSGIALLFSPYVFLQLTDGLTVLSVSPSFVGYFTHLFGLGVLAIGPVCLLAGMVFPFLMKIEERYAVSAGQSIGKLTASNTAGAILGAVVCGFVLLPLFGMWHAMHAFAILYLIAACLLPVGTGFATLIPRVLSGFFLIAAFVLFHPSEYPVLGTNPNWRDQKVLETWDTGDCSVAVVMNEGSSIGIKMNSNYILGATGAAKEQIYQGRIPLYIVPDIESVFFLGMGTGMTAGSILDKDLFPNVKRVVACELVEEVVHAAQKYLTGRMDGIDYTFGLFEDPRVDIIIDDGRHYLMGSNERFDMIQADLFLPYRNGAGSLYSLEHFETVYESLSTDGVFVQWLPMFQLTEYEFGVISRTMLQVFENVTMWRNDFHPGREIVALVGSRNPLVLPAYRKDMLSFKQELISGISWQNLEELHLPLNEDLITIYYCGDMSKVRDAFSSYPLNTDDRPVIEYSSPISMRQKGADGRPPTLVGPKFSAFTESLFAGQVPAKDPVLAQRTSSNRRLSTAGYALQRAWVGYAMGDAEQCQQAWDEFVTAWLEL